MELLRRAIREDRAVAFGCAEADGHSTAHTVRPISLAAGQVRGYESGRSGLTAYPVHRITWIRLVDDADDDYPDDSDPA
jgi:predicted DNA-binding transcriptional regulator YafY